MQTKGKIKLVKTTPTDESTPVHKANFFLIETDKRQSSIVHKSKTNPTQVVFGLVFQTDEGFIKPINVKPQPIFNALHLHLSAGNEVEADVLQFDLESYKFLILERITFNQDFLKDRADRTPPLRRESHHVRESKLEAILPRNVKDDFGSTVMDMDFIIVTEPDRRTRMKKLLSKCWPNVCEAISYANAHMKRLNLNKVGWNQFQTEVLTVISEGFKNRTYVNDRA